MAPVPATTDPADGEVDGDDGLQNPPGHAARNETIAGAVLVGLFLLAALWFRARPAQTFVDSWGFSFVHPNLKNRLWQDLSDLKSLPFLLAGSILAALVVVARDRWRALVCLTTPVVAVILVEYFFKPVVARHFDGVVSFPSGTVTAISALAMAWVIAVPSGIRPVVAVVGAFLVGLECLAVTGLLWHYPSDALGGAVLGAGFVLLVDGGVHLAVAAERRWRDRQRAPAGDPVAG